MAMRSTLILGLFLVAACSGRGSDVGPRFELLPDASCKASVFDDQGRGVVDAEVSFPDLGGAARTGINGRADLLANPTGRVRVRVDGTYAAASAGDRLATIDFAVTMGRDLPVAVYLPDLPDSASAALTAGTQVGSTAVTSVAGTVVTVAAASSVSLPGGAASGFLRVGDLQSQHLPGDLPTAGGTGALLFTKGVFVAPAAATFTAGATLDIADDLALPGSATATLYRLDAATGEWQVVTTGLTSSGGRIVAANQITGGGMYAVATTVPSGTVIGRLRDASTLVVPEQLVNVDGRWTVTDGGGRFTVNGVPAVLADGSPRAAQIEFFAGGSWLPVRTTTTGAVSAGNTLDLGDVVFDTVPALNLRVQQLKRGRVEPRRHLAASSSLQSVARVTTSNDLGQAVLEDMPSFWFGFQEGHPYDQYRAYYAQSVGYANAGQRWLDAAMYFDEIDWFIGSRQSRLLVVDSVGGGPIYGAGVTTGGTSGVGFAGIVLETGTFFIDRPADGRVTASATSTFGGLTTVSALSIDRPNGEHLELPLERSLRPSLGAYDRHGLVAGTLTGADPARVHELRSTRWLEAFEWWNDLVDGIPLRGAVPLDIDPATTHAAFQVGVDANGGHLVAAELAVAGPVRTLDKLGVALALVPEEGTLLDRDLALDLPATTTFVAPGALTGLDAGIAVAALRCDLALEQPDGRFVDVVRDVGGNHVASGADLSLTLPALGGALAGHAWRVLVGGSATAAGVTTTQKTLLRLTGNAPEASVVALPPPTLTAPAAGATVPAAGFTVQFALPAGALYGRIDLVHESAGERRTWQVFVPPDATEFAFVTLPTAAVTPLVAGKTWTLTLTAYRADEVAMQASNDYYRDLTVFLQSVPAVEIGVVAVSSRSITVTTN